MARQVRVPGDDAVSPTIGVVLLIGIATALMASLAVFVLGFGPGGQAPHGEFLFSQDADENVTITYASGEDVLENHVVVIVGSEPACDEDGNRVWQGSGAFEPGDRTTVTHKGASCSDELEEGDVVRVVWQGPGSARESVLGEYEVFDA